MARGWESKAVESQMLDAAVQSSNRQEAHLSPEERQRRARHNNLVLSRTRVIAELETCSNPRFHAQLESELAFLEDEIRKLEAAH